ncbi:MAG: 30S ribosomal protein S12 methylthiotransferase RimO [bacterium]
MPETRPPKVALITLGCAKNTVDSEVMLGLFQRAGYGFAPEASNADIVVINTCGFIEDAKRESINTILEACEMKDGNPAKKVYVTGCLSQRYEQDLKHEIPEVDGWLGVENFGEVVTAIEGGTVTPLRGGGSWLTDDLTLRVTSTPKHYAYLKISEGCDHTCAFCAIPMIRGKLRSRHPIAVLQEAQRLVDNGAKELLLISQDTSAYGHDLAGKPTLTWLLNELSTIDALKWIRVHYLYPDEVRPELLRTMAALPKVCNYIDMPLQHVSPHMLKLMRRGWKHDFRQWVTDLRGIFEDRVAFRSTFLVGFPGEREVDFDELLRFQADMRIDKLTTFRYSHEDGTSSFELPDPVDPEVAQSRLETIMGLQADLSREIHEGLVGDTFEVLVEGATEVDKGLLYGRTYRDSPEVDGLVYFPGSLESTPVGTFTEVTITEADDYDLIGKRVGDEGDARPEALPGRRTMKAMQ